MKEHPRSSTAGVLAMGVDGRHDLADLTAGALGVSARRAVRAGRTQFMLEASRGLAVRHRLSKAAIVDLLAACPPSGRPVLLFKGFHLAEWVYRSPGERFYGDVDMLIDRASVDALCEAAARLGWDVERVAPGNRLVAHEVAHLFDLERGVRVDVHVSVVPGPGVRAGGRLTEALVEAAETVDLDGRPVRVPTAVDALLIALAVGRVASSFTIRRRDFVDAAVLVDAFGIGRRAVEMRADALALRRCWEAFVTRCDPWMGIADGSAVPLFRRLSAYPGTAPEIGHRSIKWLAGHLWVKPRRVVATLRMMPWILRALWALRRRRPVQDVLDAMNPGRSPRERHPRYSHEAPLLIKGSRLAARLLMPMTGGRCLVRSLATFAALRHEGYDAHFVSGVGHGPEGLEGHAWVEWRDRPIDGGGDAFARRLYRVSLEYPGKATP